MGMMVGLIPSFSIIPWVLLLMGVLMPTNLLALILSVVIFSFVGPMIDIYSHPLGSAILTDARLLDVWQAIFANKYSVWLQIHNSVVLGNTIIAFLMGVPTFVVSTIAAKFLSPIVTKYLLSNSIADWIRGYPLQTS